MKENIKKSKMTNQCEEHIFRFKLNKQQISLYDTDVIALVVGESIKAILDIVVLTYQGKEIEIDGFKFVENDNKIYSLYSRTMKRKKNRNR